MKKYIGAWSLALAAVPLLPALPARAETGAPSSGETADAIVVTARRLDEARDFIQPATGASIYRLDRDALTAQPGSIDRSLKATLLQAAGVSQDSDSDGDIHIRNEHAGIQFRLNGITVPTSFAGFGAPVDVRIASSIEVLTGALPAQYGLQTSGIVSMRTMPAELGIGGDIGIRGGGNGTIQPSATLHGTAGNISYFLSGSFLQSDLGLAAPVPDKKVLHDRTRQWRGFGHMSWLLDESSRISALGSLSSGWFQIPNTPGQEPEFELENRDSFDSALLDQNQRNRSHFAVLAYQYSGEAFDVQVAPYFRYARARYTPDPAGGLLIFNGADTDLTQASRAWGVQADASLKLGERHVLRFGAHFQHDRTRSISINRVFAVDHEGEQEDDDPIVIPLDQSLTGRTYSVYLQHEWNLGERMTLNYGLRYDRFEGAIDEDQVSPRVALVWKPGLKTIVHAAYARYFTPPPIELMVDRTLGQFAGTTGAAPTQAGDPVRAQRDHVFDIGVQQGIGNLSLSAGAYYKIQRNLLDLEQFGGSLIQSPYNFERAKSWGVKLAASYRRGPLSLYLNVARGDQKGRRIVSNQFFFEPDELEYIAENEIFTDHSQSWTVSVGGSVSLTNRLGNLQASFDLIQGSGLRAGEVQDLLPNSTTQESYVQVNLGLSQSFGGDPSRGLSLRLDVVNLFDRAYLIHDGQGVGSNQPEWGPRRAIFMGVRKTF